MRGMLLALALAAAGCGKPDSRGDGEGRVAAPVAAESAMPKPGPQVEPKKIDRPVPDPLAALPQSLGKRHGGLTAADWGQALLDTGGNGRVSVEASLALHAIGDEGLRFTLPGLASEYPAVRYNALQAINEAAAARHPDVFLPRLVEALRSEYPNTRGFAALTIARCQFAGGVGAIRDALAGEQKAEARRQFRTAIEMLTGEKLNPPPPYTDFASLERKLPVAGEAAGRVLAQHRPGVNGFATWYLQASALSAPPAPGDVIVDEAGARWVVGSVVTKSQLGPDKEPVFLAQTKRG